MSPNPAALVTKKSVSGGCRRATVTPRGESDPSRTSSPGRFQRSGHEDAPDASNEGRWISTTVPYGRRKKAKGATYKRDASDGYRPRWPTAGGSAPGSRASGSAG